MVEEKLTTSIFLQLPCLNMYRQGRWKAWFLHAGKSFLNFVESNKMLTVITFFRLIIFQILFDLTRFRKYSTAIPVVLVWFWLALPNQVFT